MVALCRLLAPSCDVVGQVADGAELLAAVERLRPDVVLVDLHLPGMNGLEACRRIRDSRLAAAVLVVSATTDADIQTRALEAGAAAFISKYRIADDLEAAVMKAFDETSASEGPGAFSS